MHLCCSIAITDVAFDVNLNDTNKLRPTYLLSGKMCLNSLTLILSASPNSNILYDLIVLLLV